MSAPYRLTLDRAARELRAAVAAYKQTGGRDAYPFISRGLNKRYSNRRRI